MMKGKYTFGDERVLGCVNEGMERYWCAILFFASLTWWCLDFPFLTEGGKK